MKYDGGIYEKRWGSKEQRHFMKDQNRNYQNQHYDLEGHFKNWSICPNRTAFFFLILGFSIDIYVDLGLCLDLGMGSIVEDEDEGESKDKYVDENTVDWKLWRFSTYSRTMQIRPTYVSQLQSSPSRR